MWFLFKEKRYCLEFQFNWITAPYVTACLIGFFKKAGEKAQVHASI